MSEPINITFIFALVIADVWVTMHNLMLLASLF